ncbi:MAG: DNA-binding protein YbiB [Oxalicibacterium faecigallinarum]|uniref:DNA-binding protein YbiB n=1 Tax=Oxalicibacterium faecigallinarum TaxID=573741 RepID=UPI00280A10C9|nr:DNA-binding protein YbiB [Oxalicibacterium faecigallinarum]MDQ7969473.1 DNA-binding protein YbiB [Oxalicibacterium faecigallinarum]
MSESNTKEPLATARFIKEIGRGVKGARSLSRDDAQLLYSAMLDGRVSDLEMGGIMLAMRIKGESVDEIAGFIDAAEASFPPLIAPAGDYAPIVVPSYNGARQLPNLLPLMAILLARAGAPVFIHGVTSDPGRVTSAEILKELGYPISHTADEAYAQFARQAPVLMPIESLAPRLHRLLAMRRILGLRNSTHTLVKIMQPFAQPALRLTSYTHPEYLTMLTDYFSKAAPPERGEVFLMRGTEGETVANAKRAQQITWIHDGECTVLVQKQEPVDDMPPLPADRDAATTAQWIAAALRGEEPVPVSILEQVEHCLHVAKELKRKGVGEHHDAAR